MSEISVKKRVYAARNGPCYLFRSVHCIVAGFYPSLSAHREAPLSSHSVAATRREFGILVPI